MTIDLSDQTILVTGASRGIGKGLAEHLAAAGASVAIHYNRNREAAEALAEHLGARTRIFQADLADVGACVRLFGDVTKAFGRVTGLVNNAGVAVAAPLDAPDEVWQQAWDTTLFVNLRAAELLSRLAIRHFQTNGGGRFVHIASRAAFRGDTAEYMAYAASKAGVVALSRSIARAFGRDNITSFVVAPGFTRTDMAQDFIDAYGEAYAVQDTALGRIPDPADIAPTVALLLSGLADHATGATIDINSGSYVH